MATQKNPFVRVLLAGGSELRVKKNVIAAYSATVRNLLDDLGLADGADDADVIDVPMPSVKEENMARVIAWCEADAALKPSEATWSEWTKKPADANEVSFQKPTPMLPHDLVLCGLPDDLDTIVDVPSVLRTMFGVACTVNFLDMEKALNRTTLGVAMVFNHKCQTAKQPLAAAVPAMFGDSTPITKEELDATTATHAWLGPNTDTMLKSIFGDDPA